MKADIEDPMDVYNEWLESGRIPMIREGIARTNALNAIVEGATYIEVAADADEKKAAEEAEKKEKAAKKKSSKKSEEKDDEKDEKDEKKSTKKSTKKSSKKEDKDDDEDEKSDED